MLKKNEVDRSFLGIIRLVKEESKGMDALEESMTMQKPKWDQALPSSIRAVLEEFDDVFPQDLPLGLPPVREGMSSKLILRMRCPQSIAHCTRLARSSWTRPRNKLRACSSMASSDHQILPMVPQSCSYPRRMGAFGFVLTTVGWTRKWSRTCIHFHYNRNCSTSRGAQKCLARSISGQDIGRCR